MTNPTAETHASEELPAGPGELLLVLWRARLTLVLFGGLGLAAALLLVGLGRPAFRARAQILIEQGGNSGVLGDLAALASVVSAPATASELSVLESRNLAQGVLAPGRDPAGAWDPADPQHVGWTVRVDDLELAPFALLARRLRAPPAPDEPLVLPPRGVHARVLGAESGAATVLELEFLTAERVRVTRAGLSQRLRLGARAEAELPLVPGTPLTYQGLTFELAPWGEYEGRRFRLEYQPPHEALEEFAARLDVRETALNSGVIEVAFTDSDPRRAARVVQALVASYLDSLAARGHRRASTTLDYVKGLLDEEFRRIDEAQERVMQLQLAHPELISPDGSATALIEQLSTLEVERIQLEVSRRTFQDIVEALENGDLRALARIDSSFGVGVLVDPVTNALLSELARLEAQASAFGADLLETHPLVVKNREATAGLVQRLRAQLAERLAGVRAREEELARVRAERQAQLAQMPEGLRELAETRVELAIHREIVPTLLKSLQGAEITRSAAETFAEVLDPAVPPSELAAPDAPRLCVLGLLGGLALGAGVAFLREPRRGRVHTGEDLRRSTGLERVYELPRLAPREPFFRSAPAGREAEAVRVLRAALRFGPEGEARRTLGLTELGPGDAGVRAACELAFAYAAEGRRTLLVEADLRTPSLAARLALDAPQGLAEHLESDLAWEGLVRTAGVGGPEVLVAGTARVEPSDLLARPAMERFLGEARTRYEAVVVALPGAEGASEVQVLARALDLLCAVHRARSRPREAVVATARTLRGAGARALTGVLVRARR